MRISDARSKSRRSRIPLTATVPAPTLGCRRTHRRQDVGDCMNTVLPREFTDSVGMTWTVREITPGPMPPKLHALLGGDRRSGGWLLFLSAAGEKRRLGPIPIDWAALSDDELESHCRRSRRVPPAPARRAEDRQPPGDES
jgi:hypothetical protein